METEAVAHRYFNGKTKGVKVIFHNFHCVDTTHSVVHDGSSTIIISNLISLRFAPLRRALCAENVNRALRWWKGNSYFFN